MGLLKYWGRTALRRLIAVAALLGAVSVLAQSAESAGSGVKDAFDTIVAEVAEGAAAGRELLGELDEPTRGVLERMSSGTDFEYVGFSVRTQVEALYNLAEAGEENGGMRFVAKLHRMLSGQSAIVQLDEGLQAISNKFTRTALGRDMVYADPRTTARSGGLLKPLPENIAKAVDLLAGAMAPHEFSVVTELAARHLRLGRAEGKRSRRVVDQVIMTAGSRRDVLDRLVRAHGPPPPIENALRALVRDVASRSAVFAMDERVATVLRELGQEPLPPRLEAYERLGNQLPSRTAQQVAVQGRGRVNGAPGLAGDVVDRGAGVVDNAAGEPPAGGGGPSYEENRRRHASYRGRIHSANGVPRAYSVAVRSSRAARGVAVGAGVEGPGIEPERAFWVPGPTGVFGRLVVEVPGEDRLAATRYLFGDSFEASVSMLWDDHGETTALSEGEVVILMSMDPESEIGGTRREEVYARVGARFEELRDELEAASADEDPLALLGFLVEAENIEAEAAEELAEIPRGIVIHPAAYGRELAWSAARVDFWFNDLDVVSREGAMLNGGETMPPSVGDAWSGRPGTWQFYELDAKLSIIRSEGLADNLVVRSRTPGSAGFSEGRRFSVSLFSFDEEAPSASAQRNEDEGTWRLDGEEVALQPMLDWMFANHHDFIRLNDFSESLSILRWLHGSGCEVLMIDSLAPKADGVATPDRVFLDGVLPHAGPMR